MTTRFRSFSLAIGAAAIAATSPLFTPGAQAQRARSASDVVPGVEVLLTDSLHLIKGKRVGLLTNHTGKDRNGVSTIDLLMKAPDVKLTALFGPEHGIRGVARAGEKMVNAVDPETGVPVFSLYGDVQIPTKDMLDRIDVLVYDIQDVGARVYTYQWTLATAANAAGKPVIVLDRPVPIRGDRFEGNFLDPAYPQNPAKVKHYPIIARYGLTPGELMKYLVGEKYIKADIRVVPMKNYTRAMWYDETKLPRINASPNLRNAAADLLYTGTTLFEGTSVAEGRGTSDPFAQVGAPWLTDNAAIAAQMNAMKLSGVRFDTVTQKVVADSGYKFGGETIHMVRLTVTDRNSVRAMETGVKLMRAIRDRHPKEFTFNAEKMDRLTGGTMFREAFEKGTVDAMLASWDADAQKFSQTVKPYLIYR
ncbi:MAG: exo-beta-N-acetylmuramidase NamZ family protein [Gemmatimonas sp.]